MIKNWLSHRKPDLQINAIQVTIFRLHVLFYLGEFPLSHKPRHHFLNSLPSEGIEMMSGFTKSLPSPQNLAIFRLGGIHDFGGEFTPPPRQIIFWGPFPHSKRVLFSLFLWHFPHIILSQISYLPAWHSFLRTKQKYFVWKNYWEPQLPLPPVRKPDHIVACLPMHSKCSDGFIHTLKVSINHC